MKHFLLNLTLVLASAAAGEASAETFERVADALIRSARSGGVRRIAVMPPSSVDGHPSASGSVLAARLEAKLTLAADIEVIERRRLDHLLSEQGLGAKGVVRADPARALGRVAGADAIVTGTYISLREGKLEVHFRLVDAESARILATESETVRVDWETDYFSQGSGDVWDTPPPPISFAPTERIGGFTAPAWADLRDALNRISYRNLPGFTPQNLSRVQRARGN